MDSEWIPIGASLPSVSCVVRTASGGLIKGAWRAGLAWARWFWRLSAGGKLIALVGHAIAVIWSCGELVPGRLGLQLANAIVLALTLFVIAGLLAGGSAARERG